MTTKIKNAVLVDNVLVCNKNLYIKDGIISEITGESHSFDIEIDAEGLFLSPGFIDIHTHGAGGFDFADGSVNDILSAASIHANHGTTTVFPTCTSSSTSDTLRFLSNVYEATQQNAPGKAFIAGSHLEGPYFSLAMCGAQNPEYIKNPDVFEMRTFYESSHGTLRRVSFAPELPNSEELCRYLLDVGIVPAFGHTGAIYEELLPIIKCGCRLATHLYSGMNGVTRRGAYRKLGAVETTFLEDAVTAEIIADGKHLPIELLQLIYKIKGADRLCLITDSMRGAGMGNGKSVLGPLHDGMDCVIKDGVAFLPDMKAFAGSVATADRLVRVMHKEVGIPLCDCIKMMCETPARVMGLCNRGRIAPKFAADLVFFDGDITVKRVFIGGTEKE